MNGEPQGHNSIRCLEVRFLALGMSLRLYEQLHGGEDVARSTNGGHFGDDSLEVGIGCHWVGI